MGYMWPVHLWNHWSIQILVLLSLALQLALFLLARIRRQREAYPVLRLFLWLAYLLADTTAIYVLGHLSISCTSREHRLTALWAAFLIMHLGGPDSITAYALEDNQLWLRHLVTFFVQVLGAAYVIYKNIVGSGTFFVVATILTSVVGVAKFGERTCSLKCSILDNIKIPHTIKYRPPPEPTINEEFLARLAHSLFDICRRVVADSPIDKTRGQLDDIATFQRLRGEYQYMVMGMELSLMYDILYTKATVIHGWPGGFCIRVASPLATVASLVLFLCSSKEVHSRIDVAVTYSLLAGALLLDTASLLSLLGSTWFQLCATRWTWLRGVVVSHHWFAMMIGNGSCRLLSRSWSGTMGQYNMLHLCARRDFSPLLGRLAKGLQIKERWEKKHYSGSIEIPEKVRESVLEQIDGTIMRGGLNTLGIIMSKWGENTLSTYHLEGNSDLRSSLGTEFQEGVIIWHVGTDLFLAKSTIAAQPNVKSEVEAVRAMSNYMVFLLVKRPYMLPGLAQNRLYQQTSDSLVKVQEGRGRRIATTTSGAGGWLTTMLKELFRLHDDPSRLEQTQSLATWLLNRDMPPNTIDNSHLVDAIKLAQELLRKEEASGTSSLELVLRMWSDFLVHAANRCSRESHAKKLNSGGEFTTLIWLLTEHFNRLRDRFG